MQKAMVISGVAGRSCEALNIALADGWVVKMAVPFRPSYSKAFDNGVEISCMTNGSMLIVLEK